MMNNNKGELQVRLMDFSDVENLIENLPDEEKEKIAGKIFEKLPTESKAKLLGKEIKEAGLTVLIGGSNCLISTEISVQIQNSPNIDLSNVAEIIEALVEKRRKDRS